MHDREKVIRGLECCKSTYDWSNGLPWKNCPYSNEKECGDCGINQMFDDALAILQEQEVVLAHWDDDTGHWIEGDRNGIDPQTRTTGEMIDTYRCSWCGFYQYWKTPFCPNCGAKMEGR